VFVKSLDTVVFTMASDGLDDTYIVVRFPVGIGDYTIGSVQAVPWASLPTVQWVVGVLSLQPKQPGRVTDHSSSSSVELKNEWI
jgi:hypothetical protein